MQHPGPTRSPGPPHTSRPQSTRSIARDVFGRAFEAVSSIVVIPLFSPAGRPLGGLYFAADAACAVDEIQGALLVGAGADDGQRALEVRPL